MRKSILIYGAVLLGIAGVGYAAGQAVHNHTDTAGGASPPAASSTSTSPVSTSPAPTNTAMPDHHPGTGGGMGQQMMGHEMGMAGMGAFAALHGVMQRPLARSLFGAFLLPEMQTELGLSTDQVNQLRQAKQELLTKGDGFAWQIAAKEKELDALFSPDTSKGQQVKKLLEQIAELRAQQHYAIYTTSRKMKAVLGDDQRNRLEAMKPDELHHAAMSHLTLGDLARAMQFLEAGF